MGLNKEQLDVLIKVKMEYWNIWIKIDNQKMVNVKPMFLFCINVYNYKVQQR